MYAADQELVKARQGARSCKVAGRMDQPLLMKPTLAYVLWFDFSKSRDTLDGTSLSWREERQGRFGSTGRSNRAAVVDRWMQPVIIIVMLLP
jgi:hypothetical protein